MLIRKAERKDMPEILELIKELALIRNNENVSISVYDLMRDGFSENPKFYMYIAESEREVVGFALFYKSYSFTGKSIFIEDVYVTKRYKKQGIALSLFSKVLDFSLKNKVSKIVWLLEKKYKSLKELYLRAGAKIIQDTTISFVNKEDIAKIVSIDLDTKSPYFNIRFMESKDSVELISLLEESDKFKKQKHQISVYDLMKYGFGETPWFKTFVIEINQKLVGYLMFHEAYNIFKGKSIHLEEVFIKPEFQGIGIGKILYFELFKHAQKENCNKITQAINYTDTRAKELVSFYKGNFNPELQVVEITDKALGDFINSKE